MRKADYAALAAVIHEQVRICRAGLSVTRQPAESRAQLLASFGTARAIAHACARRLNVDRVQFLTACGLAPN